MNHADRLAREAANRLQGTAKSLHDLGPEFEVMQNKDIFCRVLDDLVFCCETCGWWWDEAEQRTDTGSGFICSDCNGEDGDYE